jgi:hypothetical protein
MYTTPLAYQACHVVNWWINQSIKQYLHCSLQENGKQISVLWIIAAPDDEAGNGSQNVGLFAV